jgi:hypothetical protein
VDQAKSPALTRAAGGLALAGALVLALPMLWGAFAEGDSDIASIFAFIVALLWTNSPAAGAAACVAASRTESGRLVFLGVEILLTLAVLGQFADDAYIHPSSMGGFLFLTWPLLGWPALLAFMGLAYSLGWRARGSWPDPPAAGE